MPNDVAGPTLARLQAPWRQPGGGATLARWARPGSALTVQPAWGEAPALRKAQLAPPGPALLPTSRTNGHPLPPHTWASPTPPRRPSVPRDQTEAAVGKIQFHLTN